MTAAEFRAEVRDLLIYGPFIVLGLPLLMLGVGVVAA